MPQHIKIAKMPQKHQRFTHFSVADIWSVLNNCMNLIKQKNKRDLLTQKQFDINYRQKEHTIDTNIWLQKQGLTSELLNTTHVKLLQAQRAAHHLLTQHKQLLTENQTKTLIKFTQKMNCKRTREKLKPEAAYPILNISSKINRQLFKLVKTL
jgi:hypothetical protein